MYQAYSLFGKGVRASEIGVIAQYLKAMGHEVCVLAVDYDRSFGTYEEKHRGVDVIHLGKWMRFRNLTVSLDVFPFCLRRLRSFDIVHIYGLYDLLGPVVAWFCRRWGIPYVVEPIGMFRPLVRSLRKKRLYNSLLGGVVLGGAARIIATSHDEREELIEGGISDGKVIIRRNGVDLNEFEHLPPRGRFRSELGLADGYPLVLYLGRLSRIKGLDLLLRAFAGLDVSAHLAIVGPDDKDGCVEELTRLREELNLQGRVVFAGPRFGLKKLEALADADLFVLPSQHENFGNAVVEAVVCGVPVIVTDRCGVAPYVRDRAGLVVPYDAESLRGALDQMLTDRELRERFQANTAHVKNELSWDEPVALQEQVYRALLTEAVRDRSK